MIEASIQPVDITEILPKQIGQREHSIVQGRKGNQTFNCEILPEIRKSYEAWVESSQFDNAVDHIVAQYLKDHNQVEDRTCNRWKMLQYNKGHFAEHVDKQEDTEKHYQVATQILLPPKKICNYEGGVLKIRTKANEILQVTPNYEKWTHVIIPIGLPHEVTEVSGTRISYVRQIFVKKSPQKEYPRQTDLPQIQTLRVIVF